MIKILDKIKNMAALILLTYTVAIGISCEKNYKKYPETENITVPDIVIDSSFSSEEIEEIIFAIKEYNKAVPELNLSYRIEPDPNSLNVNFEKSSTKISGLAGDAAKFYLITIYSNNIQNNEIFREVVLHELGHFIGIKGHYKDSFMNAVMNPNKLYGCINEIVLEQICKTHNCLNAKPTCR